MCMVRKGEERRGRGGEKEEERRGKGGGKKGKRGDEGERGGTEKGQRRMGNMKLSI